MEVHLTPSPTPADQQDALNTSFERRKLADYNWHLKQKPNIISRIVVEIHPDRLLQARNHQFRDHAIHVRLKGTPAFCAAVRCNPFYPRGRMCTKHSNLQIFKSGNTTLTACEHACTTLYKPNPLYTPAEAAAAAAVEAKRPKKPEKKEEKIDGNRVFWSEGCDACISGSPEVYGTVIDDHRRTTNHTTPHTDTIGTGYDVDEENLFRQGEDYATYYKMNKYYCEDFAMDLKSDNSGCEASLGERIAGFFIGDTIVHLLRYLITHSFQGKNLNTVNTPNVPEITPEEIKRLTARDDHSKYDDSVYCINPAITLTDLGFSDGLYHMYWTTAGGFPGRLVEPMIFFRELDPSITSVTLPTPPPPAPTEIPRTRAARSIGSDFVEIGKTVLNTGTPFGSDSHINPMNPDGLLGEMLGVKKPVTRPVGEKGAPRHLRLNRFGMRIMTEYDILGLRPRLPSTRDPGEMVPPDPATLESDFLKISKQIVGIAQSAAEQAIVTGLIKTFFKRGLPMIARAIEHTGARIAAFVMKHVVNSVLVKVVTKAITGVLSRAIMRLVSLASAPVVGIILALLTLLDLALSFIDPLRVADLQDQTAIDLSAKIEIENNKIMYGMGTWEYSPATWIETFRMMNDMPDEEAPADMKAVDGDDAKNTNDKDDKKDEETDSGDDDDDDEAAEKRGGGGGRKRRNAGTREGGRQDDATMGTENREILHDPLLNANNGYIAVDRHMLIAMRDLNRRINADGSGDSSSGGSSTPGHVERKADEDKTKKYTIDNPHPKIGWPLTKVTVNPAEDFIVEMQYQILYLNTLTVNSEGQKIDMETEGRMDMNLFSEQARKHAAALPNFSSHDFEIFLADYSANLKTCNYALYVFSAYIVIVPAIITLLSLYSNASATAILTIFCVCSILSMLLINLYTRALYRPDTAVLDKGTRRQNRLLDTLKRIADVHGQHAVASTKKPPAVLSPRWL